ncbi:hypothetical protein [Streptosporangium lutulentum]|uniref:Uncharacterized protein n=1 Tax=Streptosporangium lutulentum TaxID=1461250 RepID=A0ABT9QWH9_9ACTN|nr:hypothetical protein [Streptosporangium lutulentum]MDP9850399.1 hypothetical protein [Streptosporangium lutulentum]
MNDHTALTSEIAALGRATDSIVSATADAIIDGEWETATEMARTAQTLSRQLQFRRDDLADLADEADV